jgi:DNA excision repair protein ERCC-2
MQIELRPWQKKVRDSIHDADEDTTIAINAPTGSGKTLLSLKIAEKLGADVIIVGVRTRTEQRRFWEDIHKFDLPYYPLVFFAKNDQCLIERDKNKDLQEEIENETEILCSDCKYTNVPKEATDIFKKISVRIKNGIKDIGDYNELNDLIDDLGEKVTYHLEKLEENDDFPGTNPENYRKFLSTILEDDNVCTYAFTKNMSYYAALAKVPIVLIGTYPYIFSFPSVLFKRLYELPNAGNMRVVTIIDEAHNLDNLDFTELRISTRRLEQIIERITNICSKGAMTELCKMIDTGKLKEIEEKYDKRLKELAKQRGLLDNKSAGITHKRLCGQGTCETEIMEELLGMLDEFVQIVKPLEEFEKSAKKKVVTPFIRTVHIAKTLFEYWQGRSVHLDEFPDWMVTPDVWYFYLTVEDNVLLSIKPISPKPIITNARRIFRGPWIIMSGTLYNREYIKRVWGLEITHYIDAINDDGYEDAKIGQMDVRIIDKVMNKHITTKHEERNDEMNQRIAMKIGEIITTSNDNGAYLVVYPNYRLMREIADYMQHLSNDQIMQFREDRVRDMGELVDLALKKKLVLHAVAKGRFTEGVELTHNNKSLIKHIIVVGVPFPNIKDEYVQDRIRASGYGEWEWLEEHARITTLQAIGRGIRYPDDSVTVWLLDKRYVQYPKYAFRWGIKPRLRITY